MHLVEWKIESVWSIRFPFQCLKKTSRNQSYWLDSFVAWILLLRSMKRGNSWVKTLVGFSGEQHHSTNKIRILVNKTQHFYKISDFIFVFLYMFLKSLIGSKSWPKLTVMKNSKQKKFITQVTKKRRKKERKEELH